MWLASMWFSHDLTALYEPLGVREATFKEYITDPKKKLPGIKMIFPGIRDELNRDDLYAYVSQFALDGKIKK